MRYNPDEQKGASAMHGLKEAAQKIRESGDIAVAGHVDPDGDSIGSLLSLGLGIEQLGKRVCMISSDGVPKMYRSLPGAERIVKKTSVIPDLAIAVDCGSRKLLGRVYRTFREAKCILNMDHHESRETFGDVRIIDPKAAAVGELVYMLLDELRVNITRDIAQNILTSIIVETNSFRLPNIGARTFEVCGKLMKTGVDFHSLSEMVYWSKRKEASMLAGLCLSRCRFSKSGRVAWSVVTRKDFDSVKAGEEDAVAVPNEMLAIKGVEAAVFFKEKNGKRLRVSLRSKGRADILRVAEEHGGGGHFDAAGCLIPNSRKAVNGLLRSVENSLEPVVLGVVSDPE